VGVSDQYCGWMMRIRKLIDEYESNFGFGRWFLVSGFDGEEWFCREREREDDYWEYSALEYENGEPRIKG